MTQWSKHYKRWVMAGAVAMSALALSGCGTIATIGKLEDGAGSEFMRVWDRWVESGGDIAVTTTWERKVKEGITPEEIEEIIMNTMVEYNLKAVGKMPLSKELEARSGKKEPVLTIWEFCSPTIARHMADFSPHMTAYMPCRIALVEQKDGLWLYTLNMDMMIKLGRKLPPELKVEAMQVRDAIWNAMERAATGAF